MHAITLNKSFVFPEEILSSNLVLTFGHLNLIVCFEKVLGLEEQKGEWGFKALKQMTKINFKLGRLDEMMNKYKQLLTYIKVSFIC